MTLAPEVWMGLACFVAGYLTAALRYKRALRRWIELAEEYREHSARRHGVAYKRLFPKGREPV